MQEVFIEVSKAVFAICDSESMYIYNLMEYVHSRKEKSLRCRRLPEWKVSVRVRKRKQ